MGKVRTSESCDEGRIHTCLRVRAPEMAGFIHSLRKSVNELIHPTQYSPEHRDYGIQEVFDVVPVCPPGSHPWGSPAP